MIQDEIRSFKTLRLVTMSGVAALTIFLAACNEHKAEGQTVAVVDGVPITETELQLELASVPEGNREAMRAQVLNALIERKLLVAQAQEQGLDQKPEYTLQVARLGEILLTQQLIQGLVSATQEPTDVRINSYLAEHPNIGENRRIIKLTQAIFTDNGTDTLRRQLEATKSMDELKAVLDANDIGYIPNELEIDSATAPQELLNAIAQVDPGEPFIFTENGQAFASVVLSETAKPISQDERLQIAQQRMRSEQSVTNIRQNLDALKSAASIEYSDEFQPEAQNGKGGSNTD